MKGCAQLSPRHESAGYVYVASLPFNVPKSCIRLLSLGSADVRVVGYPRRAYLEYLPVFGSAYLNHSSSCL
jgi:hypothetical protein